MRSSTFWLAMVAIPLLLASDERLFIAPGVDRSLPVPRLRRRDDQPAATCSLPSDGEATRVKKKEVSGYIRHSHVITCI